jgi:lipopolysaccharide export system ATP-binding protein
MSPELEVAVDTIRAENLVKEYGSTRVVDGVDIEIKAGEIVGLLGPNGAGKSTTFKMLVGFTKPTSGAVHFNSQDMSRLPIHLRARLGIAYLPQETSVFRKMTVRQNLMAVMQALGHTKKEIRPRMNELLEELGISELKDRLAEKLSGGEKRRVEIARALMTRPKFLFLDEPFTGIDPVTVEDIQGIVKNLCAKGLGLLITDHNLRETLHITRRSYVLLDGKVAASGTVKEILDSKIVRERFFTQSIVEDVSRRRISNSAENIAKLDE